MNRENSKNNNASMHHVKFFAKQSGSEVFGLQWYQNFPSVYSVTPQNNLQ